MRTNPLRRSVVFGAVIAAALIGAVAAPSNAATHVAYGELVPVSTIPAIPANGPCSIPDASARMSQAYPAQWPKDGVKGVNSATSKVLINLDSLGNLVSAHLANSSGNALLDDEALVAARGSKYAPESRNCSSFARPYYLDVTFTNQMSFAREVLPATTVHPFPRRRA